MKLNILMMFTLLMINMPANAAKSRLVSPEDGVVTGYYLSKSLTGYVNFKNCEKCDVRHYKITPSTKAYMNYKEVPLSQFSKSKNKPNGVVFLRASGEFDGIHIMTNF